jgi:tRNA modification GTPase
MEDADTICAISTPSGEGGIGIVRMSGKDALAILKRVFKPLRKRAPFQSHRLYLGHIINPEEKTVIDEVLAVLMRAPRTYTREDVVEIFCHGSLAVQRSVLALLIIHGGRLADPGEFTKRAYLNGRIDLLQAESVLDIIQSETEEELKHALNSLSGRLSRKIGSVRKLIQSATADIEAQLDFPEEELEVSDEHLASVLGKAEKEIQGLADSYNEGRALKNGLEVLIVGRTNVGKSSLLNALLLKEKAIVTPLPGTTRDLVEDTLRVKGIKIRITDTAGLRKPRNAVEKEGMERVGKRIPESDLILWVLDTSRSFSEEDARVSRKIRGKKTIAVLNKSDLPRVMEPAPAGLAGLPRVAVSATEDTGLEELKDKMHETLMGQGHPGKGMIVTNVRHRDSLVRAGDAVGRALASLSGAQPLELVAFELKEALHHLGVITGETYPDDILHEIFERFCIGK